jgi:uncharacterized protein (DUF305 family)
VRSKTAVIGLLIAAAGVAIAAGVMALARGMESDARKTDGAMIAAMTPHHEMAIEMAELAEQRSERAQVRELAQTIIAMQRQEIAALEQAHERLFGEPVAAADHGLLGRPAEHMGMDMYVADLARERRFDRAFIDMMIPHHQGAIRMARIQLERGEDEDLMAISRAIIAEQSREIEQMNAWREAWYGSPSPAGGVPAEDEAEIPTHEEMGH